MITQGPFDLTLNTGLPLNDPGANSNNPATAMQIQNASPFIVEVNAGGTVLTIQAFTAQTVPTSGGGQQMTATPISAGASGQQTAPQSLTVVWLLAGESAPMGDGPLTAAAIASSLYAAGLSGAATLTTVVVGITTGTAVNVNAVVPGAYRLWAWGWFPPNFAAAPPTKGVLVAQFGAPTGFFTDALAWDEAASNRPAGLSWRITAIAGLEVSNYFDQTVDFFATYSAA